jgi:ribosomal protein S18 acetylase RimI-like enzyme
MIRPLGPEDLDTFIQIRRDSLELFPYAFGGAPGIEIDRDKTLFDLKQKNAENFILGYFDQQKGLIGIVGCFREKGIKYRHKANIWGMFVYPDYQGKKIGEQLLKECIHRISFIHDIHKIRVCATHLSIAAIKLYQKLGFITYGKEQNAMRWNDQALEMVYLDLPLKRSES